MTDIREHNATPRAELERQIMDPNIPKNEREWWAAAEIERLRAPRFEVVQLQPDEDCPGLWIGFKTGKDRDEAMRMFALETKP